MNGLALCSGIGGLELGLRAAIPGYRTVGHVERESCAAATLMARMEDEDLDPAPIWDNLESFDGRAWRGSVDIITAGFPCQPFSVAGKQRGVEDDRWIWPAIATIIGEVRPGWVFLENVPGLVSHGLGWVLRDLAALGFNAEWDCFRASDVGAPHRRERWFLLAHSGCGTLCGPQHESGPGRSSTDNRPDGQGVGDAHEPRTDTHPTGAVGRSRGEWPPGPDSPDWGPILAEWPELAPATVADSERSRQRVERIGEAAGAHQRSAEAARRTAAGEDEAQSAVRGVADGISGRVDRLRALGNAVVPAQAELAFRILYERMTT